jgi:TetR/AcrR family transcriptional regulator, transcriptional repressor for nem operon
MARQKEFEEDVALAAAIRTFAIYGYEGTSTELLTKNMGIGRQSLYDTFGEKRSLYKQALQRYCFDSVSALSTSLQNSASPLAAIEATLLSFAARASGTDVGPCLAVGSVCEFGQRDREIAAISEAANSSLRSIFEAALRRAKEGGETAPDVDPKTAALFLCSALTGLKIVARGGAKREELAAIAKIAARCLH